MNERQTARYKGLLPLLPVLLSVAVLWSRYSIPGLTADGVTYMQIARNLLLGGELGWQALWAPPLYSLLIAAGARIFGTGDLLLVASFIGPLMGVILVAAIYKLAESLFDRPTALAAAILTALSPHLLSISYSTEPEIVYAAFLAVSLLFFARALPRRSFALAAAAGIAFALAYLSRSEGFLVMVFVLGATAACSGREVSRSAALKLCGITLICFFATASPYLSFLKKQYGTFVISPKTSYVLIWMKGRDAKIQDNRNPELWGLTASGKLKWQEPKGLKDLLAFWMADPGRSFSDYVRNLSNELPGRIPNNSGMERFPNLIPYYLFAAAVASLLCNWGALRREKKALLLSPLLIFFVLPVFTNGWWKYLVPYQPVILLLAAKGITGCATWMAERLGRGGTNMASATAALAVGAIAVSYHLALHPLRNPQQVMSDHNTLRTNDAFVTRELGTFAAQRFGPGKNYMVMWSKLVYYLDGYWTALPMASIADIRSYAIANKVDYIVFEARTSEEMAAMDRPVPGLELVETIALQNYYYKLAVYRPADWSGGK